MCTSWYKMSWGENLTIFSVRTDFDDFHAHVRVHQTATWTLPWCPSEERYLHTLAGSLLTSEKCLPALPWLHVDDQCFQLAETSLHDHRCCWVFVRNMKHFHCKRVGTCQWELWQCVWLFVPCVPSHDAWVGSTWCGGECFADLAHSWVSL